MLLQASARDPSTRYSFSQISDNQSPRLRPTNSTKHREIWVEGFVRQIGQLEYYKRQFRWKNCIEAAGDKGNVSGSQKYAGYFRRRDWGDWMDCTPTKRTGNIRRRSHSSEPASITLFTKTQHSILPSSSALVVDCAVRLMSRQGIVDE